MGGENRDDKAFPVYLRSGDIAVLMGPGRLNYHAVPRIMTNDADYITNCLQETRDKSEQKQQQLTNGDDKTSVNEKTTGLESNVVENMEQSTGACGEKPTELKSNGVEYTGQSIAEKINSEIEKTMSDIEKSDWTPFVDYIMNNRINMNVRQVIGEGQDFDAED